jgi:molybdopterin converting factor small subunit
MTESFDESAPAAAGATTRAASERPVVVRIAPALVRLFPDAVSRVDVFAPDVGKLIDELEIRWPGMRDRICDSRPAIRRHMNIFVDGRRASLATELKPGADVFILTAISGG